MMKMNLIQIAAVVLSTGTALAQASQPLTGTTSSTSQVKATPVQINPKTKPASAPATSATTANKGKVSSAPGTAKPQSGAAAKPALTKPAPGQPAAKSSSIKTASVSPGGAGSKPAGTSAKPATGSVQGGKAVAVQPTKAPAKPSPAAAQTSSKPLGAQPASKAGQAASVPKTNSGIANQKPAAPGVVAQKPTAPAPAAKSNVPQKPGTGVAGKLSGTKPGTAIAAKPVKPNTGRPTAKKQEKVGSKTKISAVEQPVKPAAGAPEQAAAPAQRRIERAGRRDPFVSPIHQTGVSPAGTCATGKRCLDIEQVVLKGIVQTREGNMALVENAAKRPYVLRENDALFNGTVERITGDSVLFRQNVQDVLGHTSTRQVVKRVTAPAV